MSGTYILGVVFSVFVFAMILLGMRNSRMKEKYAIVWVLIGVVVLVVSLFPDTLTWAARLIGVVVPLNLGFFLSGVVLLLISLQFSIDLSRVDEEKRVLAENLALLETRVAELEHAAKTLGPKGDS
ncbi:DUF2304 domain-containing protein [Mobiluncus porci]|uniref:DUF2304 domain-containing protein n=1 Tax=Mobiluncus porci TaxID=2652278 RepID=A0A7K0K3K6_9ACTO|nr:DUF2304 domain-containing protein [Mobiluncus porci]MST50061.1 DUF2304 domain-containing protein [Mobiluncus porci]